MQKTLDLLHDDIVAWPSDFARDVGIEGRCYHYLILIGQYVKSLDEPVVKPVDQYVKKKLDN